MERPKIRQTFYKDKSRFSYVYLEKSEGLRAIKILKLLPQLTKWTPAETISKMIKSRLPATLWTLYKLAGAQRLDVELSDRTEVLAEKPILLLRKDKYNRNNNRKKGNRLRATVYVKNA